LQVSTEELVMSPPNTETATTTTAKVSTTTTTTSLHYRSTFSPNSKYERNYVPPQFTIKQIRSAIPPHCFQRSTLRSFSYAVSDLTVIAILFYLATHIDTHLPVYLRYVAWPLYWFWAGAFATGIWVVAHECGHQAFSDSKTICNVVGLILHSALLVPYYAWRWSHSRHHKHTGDIHKDEVFVPSTRSELGLPKKGSEEDMERTRKKMNGELSEDIPIIQLVNLIGQQLIGWPMYLILNSSGRKYPGWANHFVPSSSLFQQKNYANVILSDIGLLVTLSVLGYLAYVYSFVEVVKYYVVPYLVVNHWLVMITFLQHTDSKLPHYRGELWDFIKGAVCTVDRHFGILDGIFHRITSTHVAHHLFSNMPHYHAEEATKHLVKVLGPYYIFDDTPMFKALWKSYTECRFIEDEGEILFFHK
jgi:omega-6 fatty acid desaturase (delta-12 desaturase)